MPGRQIIVPAGFLKMQYHRADKRTRRTPFPGGQIQSSSCRFPFSPPCGLAQNTTLQERHLSLSLSLSGGGLVSWWKGMVCLRYKAGISVPADVATVYRCENDITRIYSACSGPIPLNGQEKVVLCTRGVFPPANHLPLHADGKSAVVQGSQVASTRVMRDTPDM